MNCKGFSASPADYSSRRDAGSTDHWTSENRVDRLQFATPPRIGRPSDF
jgi:hypothetical protein